MLVIPHLDPGYTLILECVISMRPVQYTESHMIQISVSSSKTFTTIVHFLVAISM